MRPPADAFEFDRGTYFKGDRYYWRVQERLWNLDAEPDPLKKRQYIIGRPLFDELDVKTKRLSEIDLLSHFDVVSEAEAEAAFDDQKSDQRGGERAG